MLQVLELKKEIENLKDTIRSLEEENKKLSERNIGRRAFDNDMAIQLMYDMYLAGESLNDIAVFLNSSKIETATGKAWRKSSVSSILKNEKNIKKYLNNYEYNIFLDRLKKKSKIK